MRSLHRAGLLTRSSTAVSRSLLACKAPKPTPPVPTGTVRLSKGICRVAGLSSSSSSSIHPSTTASAPLGAPAQRKRLNPAAYAEAYSLDGSTCLHSPGRDSSSLQQLQEFLGYHFRKEELLAQACTHSADKQALSYRQLAFVGDAALWMLFAEHAFHKFGEQEDPISGGWPACMSGLLSRASCAATARQWELHRFLQHSSSSSSSASRSSSASSSRSSGMTNGQWSTDTLAEMFEGVVGALLLDSDYSTVQQLLKPWVTESFEAARAADAAKAAVAAGAVTEFAGNQQQQQQQEQQQQQQQQQEQQQQQQHTQGDSWVCAASSSSSSNLQELQEPMALLLQEQLYQQCGYCFQDLSLLRNCSRHALQLLFSGAGNAQADKWHFIGFGLLQFAAAQHAYEEQCQQLPSSSMWQQLPWQQGQAAAAADAAGYLNDCSTSSEPYSSASTRSSDGSSFDDDISSSSSSSSHNQVHLMSKQMVNLTAIRQRCKMWLWLGLDPSPLLPPGSYLLASKWKLQKQALSRCLDLLLAAVYLDGGMHAAMHVLQQLLQQTPPTRLCKAWIPCWAQKQGSSWGGTLYPAAR